MDLSSHAPKDPATDPSVMLTALLDASITAKREKDPPRDYLGGSRLGEECDRRLGYEYVHTAPDPGRGFSGQAYRIFDRGHRLEEAVAVYLRDAGFVLVTEKPNGGQIGFGVARDPETGRHRISGHLDGVVLGYVGDVHIAAAETKAHLWAGDLPYPLLWETKALNAKNFALCQAKGIRAAKPVYFAQAQVYMAYKELLHCFFTVINADTMEVYVEIIPFDRAAAQAASDRGVRVISAASPEQLPRIGRDPTDFRCMWCPFKARCWAPESRDAPASVKVPAGWGSWA